jgi:hypothetical protein
MSYSLRTCGERGKNIMNKHHDDDNETMRAAREAVSGAQAPIRDNIHRGGTYEAISDPASTPLPDITNVTPKSWNYY